MNSLTCKKVEVRFWLLVLGILILLNIPTITGLASFQSEAYVEVFADQDWQNTGVLVQPGDTLTIQYVSGKWSPWPGGYYDGEGSGGDPYCSCNVMMNVSHAGLIGRIGDGVPFFVGNDLTIMSTETGYLYLGINDSVRDDNSGSITVRVQVTPSAPPPPTNTWTPIPPTPTNTWTPVPQTPTNTPSPLPEEVKLVVTGFQIEPESPMAFERAKITLIIENQGGTPYSEPFWNYTGQVILRDSNGQMVEDPHDFSKDNSSSIIPVGTQMPLKWQLTINTYFWHWGENGTIEVLIFPADKIIDSFVTIQPISIKANDTELGRCGAFITRKIASVLPSGNAKAFLDGVASSEKLFTCKDIPCAASAIGKLILKYISNIGDIIVKIAGVFDLDGAKECAVRWIWVQELVKEFTRQGVFINMQVVHSPALILVTDQEGRRAGFLDNEQVLEEIQDSRAVTENESRIILFPVTGNTTTTLKGIGDGTMTITIINNNASLGKEITFSIMDGKN